jgi:hypothetical protein
MPRLYCGMPLVAFSAMPNDARVWVFGSADELSAERESVLLSTVDDYLEDWRAHGSPLTVARDWRDGRFLAIAVDQRDENASGCSLDALFRVLRDLETALGTSLLGNSRVYFRTRNGAIEVTDRAGFAEQAQAGSIEGGSHVFDLSVQTAGAWRDRFEVDAVESWHRALLPVAV